jgi:predicted nucleic acid-binding protein
MDQVIDGKYSVFTPLSVLVEVVAAISRRTGSRVLAKAVQTKLAQIPSIHFLELAPSRALHACELAIALGLRGMDALVLQMAQEMETILVTLDEELVKRGREVVDIKSVGTLVESS